MNSKVSLVVPCYNGAPFIDNFMNSLLKLEYDNIQLIITDDGSTDDSYNKLKNYGERINQKGIEFILLHKDNGGQPSAFNYGVKYATGKYISWPDIDDYMHSDYIAKKVAYMEANPQVDFLLSKSAIVPLERPTDIQGYTWPTRITDNSSLVDRVLRDYDCWFEPGAFFARADSMDCFIKDRHIYDACGRWSGPQIQIVLPFFYGGNIGYLDECLYDYYIHDRQQHSQVKSKEDIIKKNQEVKKVLISTIKSMCIPEEKKYLKIVEERTIRTETIHAFSIFDRKWFLEAYNRFDKSALTTKDKLRNILIKSRILYGTYRIYKKVRRNPLAYNEE